MNFCVIGLKWGKNYIKNLENLGEHISFICSRNEHTIPEEAKKYRHVADYKQIKLSEIDIVCICTPPNTHFEIAAYFIANKKHIIIEKPLVFEVEQARLLKEMAAKQEVSLLTSFQYLWNDTYLKCLNSFSGNTLKLHLENWVTGGVAREEYSFLWDYSSHDLAMAFQLIGINDKVRIISVQQTENGFSYQIEIGIHSVSTHFTFGLQKERRLNIYSADKSVSFEDDFKFNSLKAMLSFYIDAIKKQVLFTNIDLAIAVTETLCELDKNFKLAVS